MYISSDGIHTAVIERDSEPMNPRDSDYVDNLGHMICFHSRYRLGDNHEYETPSAFAHALGQKHIQPEPFFRAILAGDLRDVRMKEMTSGDYLIEARYGFPGKETWHPTAFQVSRDLSLLNERSFDQVLEEVMDAMYASEILSLCEKSDQVAILPLFLYDHSGLSMSTWSFSGRAQHAEWDSGQVGYIYMDKETAMRELAMAGETLTIAKVFDKKQRITRTLSPAQGKSTQDVLSINGFTQVETPEHIRNMDDPKCLNENNQPIISEADILSGCIYTKDHALYKLRAPVENDVLTLERLASFNPDLKRLTNETWKARTKEYLGSEVSAYDNYLTGDIYGIRFFEGLNEISSMWGFNPGEKQMSADIYEEMLDGWHPELAETFVYSSIDNFDIERYFKETLFVDFRNEIRDAVSAQVHAAADASAPYPYQVSAQEILSNKDNLLTDIINELYAEHVRPDYTTIHQAISAHAGISREVQPRITAADLDPDRDYTESELLALVRSKSLDVLISEADSRRTQSVPQHIEKIPDRFH